MPSCLVNLLLKKKRQKVAGADKAQTVPELLYNLYATPLFRVTNRVLCQSYLQSWRSHRIGQHLFFSFFFSFEKIAECIRNSLDARIGRAADGHTIDDTTLPNRWKSRPAGKSKRDNWRAPKTFLHEAWVAEYVYIYIKFARKINPLKAPWTRRSSDLRHLRRV